MNSEGKDQNDEKKSGFKAAFLKRRPARKPKGAGLFLLALFLAAAGGIAWFVMKDAAWKLSGGDAPVLTADDDSVSGIGVAKGPGFPASEEELAATDASPQSGLVGALSGRKGSSSPSSGVRAVGAAGGAEGAAEEDGAGGGPGGASGSGASGGNKSSLGTASTGKNDGQMSKTAGLMSASGGAASVRSVQPKGPAGMAGRGGRISVMEALRSAFKANLYGARLASQDTARMWMSKTFHANPDYSRSIEYSEQMKAKLDRVNPDSIPDFLREQNLDATSAKSLGVSKVGSPDFDREGTKEALNGDKDYQDKKTTKEVLAALFKPMGPFSGGGDNAASPGLLSTDLGAASLRDTSIDVPDSEPGGGSRGGGTVPLPKARPLAYDLSPDDKQQLVNDQKETVPSELVPSESFGGECGCTVEQPCCCLPSGYLDRPANVSGMTGDFPAKPI